jgi:hypothetical protein
MQALMETPEWIIKRLQPDDITFLTLIQNEGIKSNEWINRTKRFILPLKRCKARNLVTPVKKRTAYLYDLTTQGLEVLKQLKQAQISLPCPQVTHQEAT